MAEMQGHGVKYFKKMAYAAEGLDSRNEFFVPKVVDEFLAFLVTSKTDAEYLPESSKKWKGYFKLVNQIYDSLSDETKQKIRDLGFLNIEGFSGIQKMQKQLEDMIVIHDSDEVTS